MFRQVAPTAPPSSIVGNSRVLLETLSEARQAARSDRPLLLTGESGSGKGCIARVIHHLSDRRQNPYVIWSAPEASDTLGLREMFGHVRGAFTGADADGTGMFESAHKGTLVIDDVDKLSLGLQGALLRFLDSWTIRRIGSMNLKSLDVRLLVTSNRPFSEIVDRGLFLPDLAWRLRGLRIHVPSLRDRLEDLPHLVRHFAEGFAESYRKPVPCFSSGALDLLKKEHWPGNVRQLAGIVENLVFRASEGKTISATETARELTLDGRFVTNSGSGRSGGKHRMTREKLVRALETVRWNSAAASSNLGVPNRTFRRWMKRFGLGSRNRQAEVTDSESAAV